MQMQTTDTANAMRNARSRRYQVTARCRPPNRMYLLKSLQYSKATVVVLFLTTLRRDGGDDLNNSSDLLGCGLALDEAEHLST